ncbi:MAG: hypothetical protein MUO77_11200 [Anaerolineales bacterium]|nr:hypothetical protein [Anaerolineales bacterium]
MIQIDKGVEKPVTSVREQMKYPWEGMEVGDSFIVPDELKSTSAKSMCYQHNKKDAPKKFVAGLDKVGVLRVWRDA